MQEETELVVKAIESLKQDSSFFKDYAFPITSAFFTSLLGAGIAYFTLRRQEGIQIEKDKMDSSNKWTLKVEEARSTLIAIKNNYHGQLGHNPFQRLSAIPNILFHAVEITENYQDLSFIVPSSNDVEADNIKWNQLSRIRIMISNYNYLLKLWGQRNDINQRFKENLLKHHGDKAYAKLSLDDAISANGRANMVILIDLTENVVKLTDNLIQEMDNFLNEFPIFVKTKIKTKRLKRYGSILTFSNNGNEKLLNLLEPSPEVDFRSVEVLFGESSEVIKQRHTTGYEKQL